MSKPADIPQAAWDLAARFMERSYPHGAKEFAARAIMAAKAEERQVFVEMIEQFGSAKLIRHCRAAPSNSERKGG